MTAKKWIHAAIATLVATAASTVPTLAGPSMSSAWLDITINQDECVKKASASVRHESFNTRFEVIGGRSVYGERSDYTALVRCVADKGIVYFVVAGPTDSVAARYLTAIRDGF